MNGVDHQPWFCSETFSAKALAGWQKLVPIHSWIEFTGALKRGGPSDPVCIHLAPAMAALVRAWADDAEKPVWLQEFGASSQWMETKEIPRFLEQAIRAALAGGIGWLTWWDSHDIRSEFEFPALEYDLGLLDSRNLPKPGGLVFQKLAREFSGRPIPRASDTAGILSPPAIAPNASREVAFDATWRWLEDYIARCP